MTTPQAERRPIATVGTLTELTGRDPALQRQIVSKALKSPTAPPHSMIGNKPIWWLDDALSYLGRIRRSRLPALPEGGWGPPPPGADSPRGYVALGDVVRLSGRDNSSVSRKLGDSERRHRYGVHVFLVGKHRVFWPRDAAVDLVTEASARGTGSWKSLHTISPQPAGPPVDEALYTEDQRRSALALRAQEAAPRYHSFRELAAGLDVAQSTLHRALEANGVIIQFGQDDPPASAPPAAGAPAFAVAFREPTS